MNNNPFKPMAHNNLIEDTKDKWVLCIPSLDKTQTQRYACHNFEQAQIMLMEWLRVGWPAYLVSPQGEDNIYQAGF
jgi:hypothetical protein